MIFEWMNDPTAWAGLATLIVLEIVLGIDNLVFIAILADKLPAGQRDRARRIGLLLALVMRLVLLASISWIVTLTEPIFSLFGSDISWRDVILLIGGTFLLFKGTMELHERLEGAHGATTGKLRDAVFWQVIVQIVVLDAVFSLDSVITAVGMVSHLSVMVIAVIVSVGVMLLASRPLMAFVGRHPTVVILCLGFLLMIGVSLIAEGLGFHVPKGYLYAAIGFSVLIEAANQTVRRNIRKRVQTMDLRARTSEAILRILRGGAKSPEASQEMAAIVSAEGDEPVFSSEESGMIERVLTLGERPVRSIMIPRRDVVWLDAEDMSDFVLDEIKVSGRSRFLVCRGEIDEVLGVVHAKDLLEQQRHLGALDIAKAARPPLFVTERMPAIKLLETFGQSNMHMAVVIDEHGAVEGIVTPMDILIAIAGDLPERAEDEVPYAQQVGERSWRFDAGMPIEDVARMLDAEATTLTGDFTTLGGFVLQELKRLPQPGDCFAWSGWEFTVEGMDGKRIDRVLVRHLETVLTKRVPATVMPYRVVGQSERDGAVSFDVEGDAATLAKANELADAGVRDIAVFTPEGLELTHAEFALKIGAWPRYEKELL